MSNTFAVSSGSGISNTSSSPVNSFGIACGAAFSSIAAAGAVGGVISRRWLPDNTVPVADPKTGLMNAAWYRFFDEISANRLGGIDGPTIKQVNTLAISAADTASSTASSQAAVVQVVNTNVAAQEAVTQVLQSSDIPGAQGIPGVTRVQQ